MSEPGEPEPARPARGAAAFRTIGEVAADLDLPAHVLRFWESKFPQLKPLKRSGGRRYYRPEDVALLHRIRQCLYQEGYTIRGVQKLLNGQDNAQPSTAPAMPSLFPLDAAPEPIDGPPDPPPDPPAVPEPASPVPAAEKAPRRPRRRPAGGISRDVLEDIRRDLIEARALLGRLTGRPGGG